MKILTLNKLIVLAILVTAIGMKLGKPLYAGGAPIQPSIKTDGGWNSPDLKNTEAEELQQANSRLKQIIVKMEQDLESCKTQLENTKKELQQMESGLSIQEPRSDYWMPAKVAMVLNQDSK